MPWISLYSASRTQPKLMAPYFKITILARGSSIRIVLNNINNN